MKRKTIVICVVILAAVACLACWVLIQQHAPNFACPPSVMVDGETYFCFSEKADTVPEEDQIAG